MATKQQLYDKLHELQAENIRLTRENETFRVEFSKIYATSRRLLGIEAAAEELERLKNQTQT
jgi:hypothetical protein